MKVAYCWSSISGYMAVCWRELNASDAVDLFCLANQPREGFSVDVMSGVPHRLLNVEEREDFNTVLEIVLEQQPDVLVVSGWGNPVYRRLVQHPELRKIPAFMCMDTPYRGNIRQRLAPIRLRSFLRCIDYAVVGGERAWQYARRLGFSEENIHRGAFGYDHNLFDPIGEKRVEWPKRFLFVGRYVWEKSLDVLVEAYRRYHQAVPDPWPLTTCGGGPFEHLLEGVDGIENCGFIQPKDLPMIFAEHAVFVLSSSYESWGVVVTEAAAAGVPVICTEQVGASVEMVRSFVNGQVVPTNHPAALADAMCWMHRHHEELPRMAESARAFARPYAADCWARRWLSWLHSALH